jgi:hypothetical protein
MAVALAPPAAPTAEYDAAVDERDRGAREHEWLAEELMR